jgi:hypothetical protein
MQITGYMESEDRAMNEECCEVWRFGVKVFRIVDLKVCAENMVLEVSVRSSAGGENVRWRIDSMKFKPS